MLKVTHLPIFSDNYVWIIHQPAGNDVLVVDPGDASPIIAFLQAQSLNVVGLLITHSHPDHVGGIDAMLDYRKVPVYGPNSPAIPQIDKPMQEGDTLSLWEYEIGVIELPGHLPEHVAYVIRKSEDGNTSEPAQIFSADIIFSAGCGRIFNGTHEEMKSSLDRIKSFPHRTLIYPAHEYTAANLHFAATVEPQNTAISQHRTKVAELRQSNIPSLPTHLALELEINPFLRCHEKTVVKAVEDRLGRMPNDEDEVFKTLRLWKDSF